MVWIWIFFKTPKLRSSRWYCELEVAIYIIFQGMTSRLCVDGFFFRFLVSGSKVCFIHYFFSKVLDGKRPFSQTLAPPFRCEKCWPWKESIVSALAEVLNVFFLGGRKRAERREKMNESYQFQPSQVSYHKWCAVYLYCIYIYIYINMIG